MTLEKATKEYWKEISEIYYEGIKSGSSTFQTKVPSWEEWDNGHIRECRYIALEEGEVIGWIALSLTNNSCTYRGVAELSVYIKSTFRNKKVGSILLKKVIEESEKLGYWTLQANIIEENIASIKLHEKQGFRIVGFREKIGQTADGIWKNTILVERRSKIN